MKRFYLQQPEALAASYLAALMAGDRTAALHLIQRALADGMPLNTIYQEVLQPALYEVGRLWACDQLSVANEHLVTAVTRRVMEVCATTITPPPAGPPQIIATGVGPELHDIGLRMVADGLELRGWNTLYLGGNVPMNAIVALAVQQRVALVAVSITTSSYARYVRDLVTDLRQSAIGARVKVLVGGQPFNRTPELWRQVGADGTAADVTGAVAWVGQHLASYAAPDTAPDRDRRGSTATQLERV